MDREYYNFERREHDHKTTFKKSANTNGYKKIDIEKDNFGQASDEYPDDDDVSGEPMIRNLEYAYPHSGYATVNDEFLLGEDILVAPQLKKGMSTRQVVIPDGIWEDLAGKRYRKGNYSVDTPITAIPIFRRIGK